MLWDIFCKVIDNYGDMGVCWRLCAQLGARGERVRLWVDDASALRWMAPDALAGGAPGVRVLPWTQPLAPVLLAQVQAKPGDVWVEAFGCEIAPEFIATQRHLTRTSAWINLEYLTAESFAARSHGLPSPVMSGPGAGLTKHFFYPGFTPGTGGLLREPDLATRQAGFDRAAWLAGLPCVETAACKPLRTGEQVLSLFCYEPHALPDLLAQLRRGGQPTRLLVTPGRAAAALEAVLVGEKSEISIKNHLKSARKLDSLLSISKLPYLTQPDFDHLLWASDLNFVRGEDSLVRALWAGRPFVWQIYPQDDGAHGPKLEAFLDWLDAPPDLRRFHRVWNGLEAGPLPSPDLPAWQAVALAARERLLAQDDLATQLAGFVQKNR